MDYFIIYGDDREVQLKETLEQIMGRNEWSVADRREEAQAINCLCDHLVKPLR